MSNSQHPTSLNRLDNNIESSRSLAAVWEASLNTAREGLIRGYVDKQTLFKAAAFAAHCQRGGLPLLVAHHVALEAVSTALREVRS